MRNSIFSIMFVLMSVMASAQTRNKQLTIHVTTETGESLAGQVVMVTQTDYQLSYGTITLDTEGSCTVKVYEGNHNITVERAGYEKASQDILVTENTETTLTIREKVRTPFALQASLQHDAFTAENSISLSWNKEQPVYADDFEGYEPFAINFAPWMGIDMDHETAAALIGEYPNRGTLQYAQIINPLVVEPTWWYDYEVLRPYSGKQYVGFTRTMTGNANDDWLISPVLSIGAENVLSFMAKASDRYPERFLVYVTTKTDNPQTDDFVQITTGNYESVDYTQWHEMTYDLSSYAGKDIRFAIRYIGEYNHLGSFMLMVDDVFVGQRNDYADINPNEMFTIYVDGTEVGTTKDCNITLANISYGHHVIGVKAKYIAAETDIVSTEVDINENDYAAVNISATAESKLSPAHTLLSIVNKATAVSYAKELDDDCSLTIPSLPKGDYILSTEVGAYEALNKNISVDGDKEIDIVFADRVVTPFNITVETRKNNNNTTDAVVRWNQELAFNDSFEDYDDFATGEFCGWISLDNDKMPVYPIGLGSAQNIVTFPGSGTAGNPTPVAPIVFNPWNTVPAMLPTDAAVAAPTGDKSIVFFSPQRARADKWLISPEINVREGFVVEFTAKAYSIYPESMELCVSTDGTDLENFHAVAAIDELSAGEWMRYQADLSAYADQTVRIGFHYTSYDAFFAQLDDVTIGSEDGETQVIDFGNIIRYEISLNGEPLTETTTPMAVLKDLEDKTYVVGVKSVYQNASSEETFYTFDVTTDIRQIVLNGDDNNSVYTISGQKVQSDSMPAGVYIRSHRKIFVP